MWQKATEALNKTSNGGLQIRSCFSDIRKVKKRKCDNKKIYIWDVIVEK
jgi:hypothetical protein